MNFDEVLEMFSAGNKIRRREWPVGAYLSPVKKDDIRWITDKEGNRLTVLKNDVYFIERWGSRDWELILYKGGDDISHDRFKTLHEAKNYVKELINKEIT